MTPQEQAAPPPPHGWFSRNWKWVVGIGCALSLGCCGIFGLASFFIARTGDDIRTAFEEAWDAGAAPSRDPLVRVVDTDGARVDCGTPGPEGVDCGVKRTSGDGAFKACWDLEISCANGGKMLGHGCATVGRGEAKVVSNMPVSAFSNQEGCDVPTFGQVQNLSITSE
ncbi:MAG: hypothetical protein AB1938_01340 [Myxococcota bacterium]